MFFNISYILYVFLVLVIFFGIFYIFRKMEGIKNYTKILEKKIINLKKENKELKSYLNENNNDNISNDADLIMNKIFDIKNCDEKDEKCILNNLSNNNYTENITKEQVPNIEFITEYKQEYIDNEKLPIVVHDDTIELQNEIESVISTDNIGGSVYNKKKLSKLNLDKLKEICNSMNLSTDGTKNIIIERILENIKS